MSDNVHLVGCSRAAEITKDRRCPECGVLMSIEPVARPTDSDREEAQQLICHTWCKSGHCHPVTECECMKGIAQALADEREAVYRAGKLEGDEAAVEHANGVMREWVKNVIHKLEAPQVDSLKSTVEPPPSEEPRRPEMPLIPIPARTQESLTSEGPGIDLRPSTCAMPCSCDRCKWLSDCVAKGRIQPREVKPGEGKESLGGVLGKAARDLIQAQDENEARLLRNLKKPQPPSSEGGKV